MALTGYWAIINTNHCLHTYHLQKVLVRVFPRFARFVRKCKLGKSWIFPLVFKLFYNIKDLTDVVKDQSWEHVGILKLFPIWVVRNKSDHPSDLSVYFRCCMLTYVLFPIFYIFVDFIPVFCLDGCGHGTRRNVARRADILSNNNTNYHMRIITMCDPQTILICCFLDLSAFPLLCTAPTWGVLKTSIRSTARN